MAWATVDDLKAAVSNTDRPALLDLLAESCSYVEDVLGEAQEQINACRFGSGTKQARAHALLTLHIIASSGDLPSWRLAGPLSAEANGPASRQFAVSSVNATADESLYSTTPYGRRFLAFRRFATAVAGVTSNTCAGGGCA